MRIVHLSTQDSSGGAARAAYRLHTGLIRLGHESSMFVATRYSADPTVTAFVPPMGLTHRLRRGLRREYLTRSFRRYRASRPAGYEPFSDDRTHHGADILHQLPPGEVIHLHWIRNFVDYPAFFASVPRRTPVVWTLHDMNPFTGGCHYDHGCGRYRSRCGNCPQLGSSDAADLSHRIWQRKRNLFEQIEPGRLHIVATSHWMAATVQNSALLGKCPVTVIPLGLDVDDFAPRDRWGAREVLGIPQDAGVILFAAESVTNRRKGLTLLTEALAGLSHRNRLFMMSLGRGQPACETPFPCQHLGHIDNDRFLSLVYSAADVFVLPSLQEAFGQTALESMACGTPVVGFAVGGIPDVVRHGNTGLLVPPQDVGALRAAIADLLRDEARRAEMSANGRHMAVEEYALEVQAQSYSALYQQLVAAPVAEALKF